MSLPNTKTLNKPIIKAKWQVPMRPHPGMSMMERLSKENEEMEKIRKSK